MKLQELRKIIFEHIENMLSEDFNFDNSQKVYYPPQEVISACQKGLAAISKNNLTNHGGNEGSGESKARSIVNKEPLTHSMLKRMKAFFDKNQDSVKQERMSGKTLDNSSILQSWELWGGDPGYNWVEKEINNLNGKNLGRKKLRRDVGMEKTSTLMDPNNIRTNFKP